MIKILIIDDRRFVREALRTFLSEEPGWAIYDLESGNTALNQFSQINPDVVILDILMPGLTGLETAREIRRSAGHVKIVFMSSYYGREDGELFGNEFDDCTFIQKSETGRLLIPAIKSLLRANQPA